VVQAPAAAQPVAGPEGVAVLEAAPLPAGGSGEPVPLFAPSGEQQQQDSVTVPIAVAAGLPETAAAPAPAEAAGAAQVAAAPAVQAQTEAPISQSVAQSGQQQPTSFMDELLSGLDGLDAGLFAPPLPAGAAAVPAAAATGLPAGAVPVAFAPQQQLANMAMAMSGPVQHPPTAAALAQQAGASSPANPFATAATGAPGGSSPPHQGSAQVDVTRVESLSNWVNPGASPSKMQGMQPSIPEGDEGEAAQ
jgi:nicotinate-nucleotide--dimethylbenzimidazole phosphoribosyltransferase